MKVLSLTQPWASLVCLGAKHNETRSWYTRYRGPLLIHASKTYPGWAKQFERREPFYSALRPHHCYSYPELACGKIIGQVELVNCCSTEALHFHVERGTGETTGHIDERSEVPHE